MSNITRNAYDAMLPKGPAWDIEHDSDSDKMLDGISEFDENTRLSLKKLSSVRNPTETEFLPELEQEHGITPRSSQTEADRREYLNGYIYSTTNGSITALQNALDMAGFTVTVYDNDPIVDPASILLTGYQMWCGGPNAYAGDPGAYCGQTGGYLLVNGELIFYNPIYLSVCGDMYAGDPDAVCGRFDNSEAVTRTYPIPVDPNSWPFIFFVGGVATRDILTNEITWIEPANVPLGRKLEFERIILKYKPLFTWAGMVVTYI